MISMDSVKKRDGIFKLTPIHASVIIRFPELTEFPFHLGKTPICQRTSGDSDN